MNNKITLVIALLLLLAVGFGCSLINKATNGGGSSDNTTTTNPNNTAINPSDTAKTGVAECDEFLDLLNNDQKKPDEDMFTKKFREYMIDLAKEVVKKNIEDNKGDKEKIAKGCREAKEDYLKKKEEKNKEKPKETDKPKTDKKDEA